MPDEIVIRVEDVSKDFVLPHEKVQSVKGLFTSLARGRFGRVTEAQHALKDVSFEIKKGEFFGIVGRNGSGKSTLLKILAGIYQPTKGSVTTRGKLVPFIELGVGFNPELTGRENVFLNGAMLGFSEREVGAMYDDIVAFAELEQFMDQKLKNYSSGMQVRLAFSMATRSEADILLIDEVLAVGDADFQRKCFEYFKQLKRNKKTVVFVSHDMGAIREYCDNAVLIEGSQIIKEGKASAVAQEYMKLFTDHGTSHGIALGNDRWGDNLATTEDIKVNVTDSLITINHVVAARENFENVVIGFRLRDASGKDVTGTNTKVEGVDIPMLKKGQKITLKWNFPNVLADGSYILDPSVLHEDAITVADWWNEALSFKVKKTRILPYAVDPDFSVRIER